MIIPILILMGGISSIVRGGFVKKRWEAFVWLLIGSILIAYSLISIVLEIDSWKVIDRQ
jgi:hypothetical protein